MNARAPVQSTDERSSTPMLAACSVLLVAGFALQALAYGHGGHASISDVPRVLLHRGITPGHWPYVDRVLEYPVLAGLFLGVAVSVTHTYLGAVLCFVLAASGATLLVTWLLARRFGSRAWRWAIGTPVFLYAFQNWDTFAIAALVVGLLLFERRHDRVAGVAFGIGGACKLFPLVVVPALAARRWVDGDRRGAWRLVLASVGTFVLVNAPFAVIDARRWWWTYTFQSSREATWGSAWFYVLRLLGLPVHGPAGAHVANLLGALALVGGLGWLVVRTARVRLDPLAAAGAAVAIAILANKVYSPAYDVWLVAFFVMLPLGRRLWLSYCAVDLAVFALVYGFFDGPLHIDLVRAILPVLVVVRTALLLTVVARCTRPSVPAEVGAPRVVTTSDRWSPSRRSPTAEPVPGPARPDVR